MEITINWIYEQFPAVKKRIPANAQKFSIEDGYVKGLCTHSDILWYELFLNADSFYETNEIIPEGFFVAAIEARMHSELLIVMWKQNGRQFYFRDRYMFPFEIGEHSPEITNKKFEAMVKKWERKGKNS